MSSEAVSSLPSLRAEVTRLRLYNFRNYDELSIELGEGVNVFRGENAQGKTNLLEAVATLLLTRSPRTSSPTELIRWGQEEAAVDALVRRGAGTENLGLRLRLRPAPAGATERPRIERISLADSKPIPAREVLGRCPVVLFWPDDLQLVKSGPELRRRLADTLLSQLDRRAGDALLRFRRTLQQRNALLHHLRGGGDGDHLSPFDAALAQHGAAVQRARREVVQGLAPLAAAAMRDLTGGGEELSLRYRPDSTAEANTEEEMAAALRAALRRLRHEEVARGVTLAGPHRDDIEYLIDGRPARITASQGQQRTAVLATKLAELRYAAERAGAVPLLLLDDVFSELDQERRGQLLEAVNGEVSSAPQTLITTAEPLDVGGPRQRHFAVRRGEVTRR
jgi:DNA replication and repair protein RecF